MHDSIIGVWPFLVLKRSKGNDWGPKINPQMPSLSNKQRDEIRFVQLEKTILRQSCSNPLPILSHLSLSLSLITNIHLGLTHCLWVSLSDANILYSIYHHYLFVRLCLFYEFQTKSTSIFQIDSDTLFMPTKGWTGCCNFKYMLELHI